MKLTVCVDNSKFTTKPTKADIPAISRNICANFVSLSQPELFEVISNGQTIVCAHFNPRADNGIFQRNCNLFKHSNIIAIDLDHGLPNSWQFEPNALYTTFSHSKKQPRYRALYFLDQLVTNRLQYRGIVANLIAVNGADAAAKDTSRLFFGSTQMPTLLHSRLLQTNLFQPEASQAFTKDYGNIPDEADEKEQAKIFAKMSAKERSFQLSYVRGKLEMLKKFNGSNGESRYTTLWSTTAILVGKPYLIASVARQWIVEAVSENVYFTDNYDRDFREIVQSAYDYAVSKK